MDLRSKYDHVFTRVYRLMNRFSSWVSNYERALETRPRIATLRERAGNLHPVLGKYFWRISEVIFGALVIWLLLYGYFWRAPEPFPDHILITVERGEHLGEIAQNLKTQNVIKSSFWLKVLITLRGGEKKVIAGDYYLSKAKNIFGVSKMLTYGEFGLSTIRIVIPEGLNSMEIADLLALNLPRFDKEEFIDEARYYEGFLFPDTYFFMPNSKPKEILAVMRENFAKQVNNLIPEMEKFGKTLDEIVIMASIVEDEARQIETRRVVAGILWKRLRLDMPLQVDAVFKYYNGKTTFDLTQEDLIEDNPYNTYVNKGLPPTAISNPGLDSIRAAIAPTNTDYLFFLSDENGVMHYAIDFDGHKRNRELHLR